MNRLVDIQEALNDLQGLDHRALLQYPQWNELADDVIKKLRCVHSACQSTHADLLRSSLLTPPHSSHSNSSASSVYSDSSLYGDQHYVMASQAFDRQIYSRCVQIVEAAQHNGPIEMSLVALAHHSYMAMVDGAEDNDDASKFAQWWNQFLESIEPGRSGQEKGEVLEYRMTSLERLYETNIPQQRQTGMKILKVAVRSYKSISVHYRAFHSKSVRSLEKLANWIDELRQCCGDSNEYSEATMVLDEIILTTRRDRKKYEAETFGGKGRPSSDPDYVMCSEILDNLDIGATTDDDVYGETPRQPSIDNLMEKIFPTDHVSEPLSIPQSSSLLTRRLAQSQSPASDEDIVLRL